MYVSTLSPILAGINLSNEILTLPERGLYTSLMKTTKNTPDIGTYTIASKRLDFFQDGRLYVPSGATLVRVYAYVELGSNPDAEGQRYLLIQKNGASFVGAGVNNYRVNSLGSPIRFHMSVFTAPVQVTDGDYFNFFISGDQMTYFLNGLTNMELEVLA